MVHHSHDEVAPESPAAPESGEVSDASPVAPAARSGDEDDGMEDGDDASSVLSASTLQLGTPEGKVEVPTPPSPGASIKSDFEDCDMRDSQRPGAWLGSAYVMYNELDRELEKARKVVVPIAILYEWLVDGKPSESLLAHAFSEDDLQQLGRA